eukprot:scaffold267624_cov22-Tisochrysis_lutea.AAC.4
MRGQRTADRSERHPSPWAAAAQTHPGDGGGHQSKSRPWQVCAQRQSSRPASRRQGRDARPQPWWMRRHGIRRCRGGVVGRSGHHRLDGARRAHAAERAERVRGGCVTKQQGRVRDAEPEREEKEEER